MCVDIFPTKCIYYNFKSFYDIFPRINTSKIIVKLKGSLENKMKITDIAQMTLLVMFIVCKTDTAEKFDICRIGTSWK